MVLSDPDEDAFGEFVSTDIFTPGKYIEREVTGSQMMMVLAMTGAGFGLLIGLTIALMLPLVATGHIAIDLYSGEVTISPDALLFLTVAELGFIVPPLMYARSKRIHIRSLGLGSLNAPRDVVAGFSMGALMLACNLAITYFVVQSSGAGGESDTMLQVSGLPTLVLWIAAMFLIVGFSEELIFRGFLQRRMEIFLKGRAAHNGDWALIITSAIFAAVHLELLGMPSRFVLGLLLGLLARKTNYSILGPTIAHGLNNSVVMVLAYLGF